MTRLIAEVHKIELVSSDGWWNESGGSLFVAVAAVLAASLAAFVAIRNTRKQLEHDRELRNREHIRDVLDEASKVAGDCYQDTVQYLARLLTLDEGLRRDPDAPHAGIRLATVDAQEALTSQLQTMSTEQRRLQIRIGGAHPIASAFARAALSMAEVVTTVPIPTVLDPRAIEQREARADAVCEAYARYIDACHDWFSE
ncbi:MAG TPA: hypothetical protein VF081_15055 [Solirubrobacterales bacterium]